MPLSRTQEKALIEAHIDRGTYPCVQTREPTKLALIRMGYAIRQNLPNGITNGWALRLTEKGTKRALLSIKSQKNALPEEPDPYENWESYT